MNFGAYIGPTPITEYGCVACQKHHRLGLDAEYHVHLWRQSKHGIRERAPIGAAEEFVAHLLAEGMPPLGAERAKAMEPIKDSDLPF